ncbi:hypothetical protein C8F04DRAFT_1269670 [Mycena alexandri]|uniref:Uncharacterized protein n=1 Tax=Mycena alexandri TaxID=1745969 RepID=A0AAD6SC87_9AGAR|nr:hypothetical protein C8F04DRAFT_1269670 [Mycena alexandri]
MARNRKLVADAFGEAFGGVQSETSRAAQAGDKVAMEKKKKKRTKKSKDTGEDGAPVVRRRSVRGTQVQEGPRPCPTPLYRGSMLNVPLVRPEGDAASFGPLREVEIDVACTPLVRPEDDPTSFGPLRAVEVDVACTPLVRPEDDPTSFGPLRAVEVDVACTPLVRPEDDPASFGPLRAVAVSPPEQQDDADPTWGAGEQDRELWTAELKNAMGGFIRLRRLGGADWVACIERLLALERAWGFRDKGLLTAPGEEKGGRPKMVKEWMRYARKWEGKVDLMTRKVGPRGVEGSFAAQWWRWWGSVQPAERKGAPDGSLTRLELEASAWEVLGKTSGRNGVLLFVGCLLWWGDAVAEEDDVSLVEDWKEAVSDVVWVLSEVGKGVGALVTAVEKAEEQAAKDKKASVKEIAGKKDGRKRTAAEKENEEEEGQPRKRTRRSGAI